MATVARGLPRSERRPAPNMEEHDAMAVATQPEVSGAGWTIRHGLIGGAIAGIIFALAEMVGSVLMGMPFLAPFQAFASLALGIPPMDIPLGTAIPVGTIAHMLLSMIYGVAFAFAVQNIALLRTSLPATIIAATLFVVLSSTAGSIEGAPSEDTDSRQPRQLGWHRAQPVMTS